MAVAASISPADLLELDGRTFDALERALERRWSTAEELAASTLELLHTFLVAFLTAHSDPKKPPQIPPLEIPRPGSDVVEPAAPPEPLGALAFAELLGRRG